MKKLLLSSLVSLALLGPASAASAILNWSLASTTTGLQSIQIFDTAATSPGPIGSVGPTATTFSSGQLPSGTHTFTAVAVYAAGSAAPSNTAILTITTVLGPITNLTVTQGP